jgi:hypothetical protein
LVEKEEPEMEPERPLINKNYLLEKIHGKGG